MIAEREHRPPRPQCRPDPEQVGAILDAAQRDGAVTYARLAREIQRETRCSRATAYRAVQDAFKARRLQRADA